MKYLLHYSFSVPLGCFIIHQVLQKLLHAPIPFFDNYLDTFCFGAVATHIYALERRYFFNHNALSILEVIIIFCFLTTVSELLLPFVYAQFYSDVYDVLAIFLGVLWYWFTRRAFVSKGTV